MSLDFETVLINPFKKDIGVQHRYIIKDVMKLFN